MPNFVKAPDGTFRTVNQTYVKTGASTWSPVTTLFFKVNRTAARTITNKVLNANVATLTTSVAHGFAQGDYVRVTGVDATFNGDYIITSVGSNTFSYAKTATNVGSQAATGSARSEYWQEIWPLAPNAPTALTSTQPYQNDRIELTFGWTAPVGGAAVSYYSVAVTIGGSLYGAYQITAPTTSMTLTNNGAGFQSYAGQNMTFTVTAVASNGKVSPVATSASFPIPQLPAPPAVTSLANTVSSGDLNTTWSHVSGNRLTDFEMQVNYNGGAYTTYTVAKGTSISTGNHPWTGSAVNGGTWSCRVRARGPGGNSDWSETSGTIPSDPTISNYRFLNGVLQASFTRGANATSTDVYWQQSGFAQSFQGNDTSASGTFSITASSGWDRDNLTQYRMLLQSKSGSNTGRLVGLSYVRKLPNPIQVTADDSNTRRNGVWRSDGLVYQGYTTNGINWGYAFYGNKFYDQFNPTWVGYSPTVTGTRLFLMRYTDGGSSAAIQPRVWLHTAASTAEANEGAWSEGTDIVGLTFNENGWRDLPANWGSKLMQRTGGVKGVGVYHPSTTGNPSAQYMKLRDDTNYVLFTAYAWQIEITHDG